MFPHQLADKHAFAIAQALTDGFDRHYRLFRETTAAAKRRFEQADWHGQQRAQAQRIEYYDQRVDEAVARLRSDFNIDALSMDKPLLHDEPRLPGDYKPLAVVKK